MSNKVLESFSKEINTIQDKIFAEHIKKIIESCPDYICGIPSSSTGKYHPEDEINPNGMILHIKRVFTFIEALIYQYDLLPDEADILLAGAIMHDLIKSGDPQTKWTVKDHPILIYNKIHNYLTSLWLGNGKPEIKNYDIYDKLKKLALVCLFHSGRWTPTEAKEIKHKAVTSMNEQERKLCDLMHTADLLASRKSVFMIMKKQGE